MVAGHRPETQLKNIIYC